MSLVTPGNRPLGEWLEIFLAINESLIESMDNRQEMSDKYGLDKKMFPKLDPKRFAERKRVWNQVRKRLGSFGNECTMMELAFWGITRDKDGNLMPDRKKKQIRLYKTGDDKNPVIFTNRDECMVICAFITFYRSADRRQMDPSDIVRASLAAKGITKDNFHTHPGSPAGMITNPFDEDTHHDS